MFQTNEQEPNIDSVFDYLQPCIAYLKYDHSQQKKVMNVLFPLKALKEI